MKLKIPLLIPALAAAFMASAPYTAFAQQTPAATPPAQDLPDAPTANVAVTIVPNGPTVVMDTSMGRITCQFYQKQAPMAVANFIALAQGTKDWTDPNTRKVQHHKPLYNGTTFHRVIPEFMIQGGDPVGTGMGDPGYAFNDEIDPNLNFRPAWPPGHGQLRSQHQRQPVLHHRAGLRHAQRPLHSLWTVRRRQR